MRRSAEARRVLDALEARRIELESEHGETFEWDEREQVVLRMLGDAIDRKETLKRQFADADKPSTAAKISAELRQLERTISEQLGRLDLEGAGEVKSQRHQKAARTRWDRKLRVAK